MSQCVCEEAEHSQYKNAEALQHSRPLMLRCANISMCVFLRYDLCFSCELLSTCLGVRKKSTMNTQRRLEPLRMVFARRLSRTDEEPNQGVGPLGRMSRMSALLNTRTDRHSHCIVRRDRKAMTVASTRRSCLVGVVPQAERKQRPFHNDPCRALL